MANMQLLNNIDHQDLRVTARHDVDFGDNVGGSLIFPEEFLSAHREYPILLQRDSDAGEFQIIALFGFFKDQNLFLKSEGWCANYVPLLMRKEPFFIGFQNPKEFGLDPVPVIHIDLESPRVSHGGEGERLFLESGGNSAYLEDVKDVLMKIHSGVVSSKAFVAVLEEYNLVEQCTLDVVFDDGSHIKTSHYYTVNQDALGLLDDKVIGSLHRKGILPLVYMMQYSLGNIKNLIDKKNKL